MSNKGAPPASKTISIRADARLQNEISPAALRRTSKLSATSPVSRRTRNSISPTSVSSMQGLSAKYTRAKDKDFDDTFSIALVGDTGVGKSALVTRETETGDDIEFCKTKSRKGISITFHPKHYDMIGTRHKVVWWDTPGAERYMHMTGRLVSGCAALVFVFDVTRPETFQHIGEWLELFIDTVIDQPKLLIANKCDQVDRRLVSSDQATIFASRFGLECYETSALTGYGVEEAMYAIAQAVARRMPEQVDPVFMLESGVRVGYALQDKEAMIYRKRLLYAMHDTVCMDDSTDTCDWLHAQ